ncbi:hypothetical protein THAOC_31504 [Thalassiosira oceanica]|uniref:Uncharacterized protein n=1 Tax=Thalassiosira oceanica TaxID=159749 RepID=K0RBD8_THAOC|nr:hypothetical protein THAOC_31504 [Thalassiosira oceanica]|mmetsp:Transcript_32631/g.77904  ORF Transcript_32631/g.77904 Transcript_32631/m.77904 type:complete len:210 (-) Transcript_32631:142-771(-)|eukprot:EJK49604.1 hypothetical protein THAOC_31504 [Thalassiosira oceanica]
MTPYDEYFAKIDAMKQKDPNILGPMLIRGIPQHSNDSDEEAEVDSDEEENEDSNSKYTAEQMSTLRHVLITQKRNDRLDEMREYVLGEQANESLMMFNTSFSYEVKDGFYHFKTSLWKKAKTPADKFDLLFAYTYNLFSFDVWMNDNEGDMEGMVSDLAGMWKRLLKNDDEKLGIDAEYTRPGVIQHLEDFKKEVEGSYSEPPFQFNYQ